MTYSPLQNCETRRKVRKHEGYFTTEYHDAYRPATAHIRLPYARMNLVELICRSAKGKNAYSDRMKFGFINHRVLTTMWYVT